MTSESESSSAAVPVPPAKSGARFRAGHWLLIVIAALLVVAAVEVAGVFRLAGEARELRTAMVGSAPGAPQTQVQLTVGPLAFGLTRLAAECFGEMPPEARQALAAMRSASVGVYTLERAPTAAERLVMLRTTSERLAALGWSRLVAVNDGNDTVMVFVPDTWEEGDSVRVCVAVCDGTELVVVSARAGVDPLLKMAAQQQRVLALAEFRHWQL